MILVQTAHLSTPCGRCVECDGRAAVRIDVGVEHVIIFYLCAEHFNHLRSELQHVWDTL